MSAANRKRTRPRQSRLAEGLQMARSIIIISIVFYVLSLLAVLVINGS